MNAEVKQPAWWPIIDSTGEIPGVVVPQDHPTPYWTKQLLTEEEADEIYYRVIAQYPQKQLSRVYKWDGVGDEVNLDSRYTHYYDIMSLPNAREIEARFNEAVEECTQTWWKQSVQPVYAPQILGYEERCHFKTHCDNSIWTNGAWMRNDPTRDITALLYVSECVPLVTKHNQHSGGELVMDNVQTANGPARITPRKGQFIAFPSHPVYRHQVTQVTRGYRIAFVNWWTLR
jgi:Rps23 Pro-64 3,4-dihydroxylase Tpa1-like proline 4-hydroxylase